MRASLARAGQAIIGDKAGPAPRTLGRARAWALIFSPSVANMRHLTLGQSLFPRHSRALEGEAHPGLEAVKEIRVGLEQRPAAERPAEFLVENRLRRLSGRINADEPTRIGEERQ